MTACFTCDGPGCSAHATQGTITGGTPTGWTLAYEVREVIEVVVEKSKSKEVKKSLTHTWHYCPACKAKRAAEREERLAAQKGKRL